jgi:SpoVK/Ycf46/Vps4 family AAA+-type ATPase
MTSPNPAVTNHVRRLRKALMKAGQDEQAAMLGKLEETNIAATEIQPSRVVLSFSTLGGEPLTPSVKPPVDRETSAPLAEILHPSDLRNAKKPILSLELLASTHDLLNEWHNVPKLQAAQVRPAMSLMLFGAPGTGKTMLSHAIARELDLPVVVARLDGLVSSFLGTTARNIANLFSFANRYRCILLLDEFDAVAKLRDDPNELGELKRVVNTLLQCLDSRAESGFTIAITNHEVLLDPAVWRRFDIRIEVPKPDWSTRLHLVRSRFDGTISLSDVQLRYLAWLTAGQTGADIERMADFIKRHIALRGEVGEFTDLIRNYVSLSAQSSEQENRQIAIGPIEEIAFALASDDLAPMNQEQLAELLGRAQPTISRWLKDRRLKKG